MSESNPIDEARFSEEFLLLRGVHWRRLGRLLLGPINSDLRNLMRWYVEPLVDDDRRSYATTDSR